MAFNAMLAKGLGKGRKGADFWKTVAGTVISEQTKTTVCCTLIIILLLTPNYGNNINTAATAALH